LLYVGAEVTIGGKNTIISTRVLYSFHNPLPRMDYYIYHRRQGRRGIVWIHLNWIFFWSVHYSACGISWPTGTGMMIGRVALLWLNEKIGEHTALLGYAACAIGLEFIVWFAPSLVGDAVTVAIIGVLLGPMYPIAMNHGARVFPRRLQTGAMGFVAGSGQAGSALVPFMAGAIASKAGIAALQPVLVGILGFMTVIWVLVARKAWAMDKHN